MSSITGSCSESQSQLLIQQGLLRAQAENVQRHQDLSRATVESIGKAAPSISAEPNKGINIDVYA